MSIDKGYKNQDTIIISSKSIEEDEKNIESLANIEDKIEAVEKKYSLYIQGHQYRITHFQLSFDYDYLLSYSMDHYIKIWDIKNNRELTTQFFHDAETLAIFRNFKYLIASKDSYFYILKANIPGKYRKKTQGNTRRLFSQSIDMGKSYNKNEDYNLISNIIKELKLPGIFPISCFVLSSNRKYAIIGCFDRTIRIFNMIKRSQNQILPGHNLSITALSISNDRKYLVSASCDGYLRTWYIDNSQQISCALSDKGISALAIAKDNSFIVAISYRFIYKMTFNLIEIIREDIDFNSQKIEIAQNKNRIILYGGLYVYSNVEELDIKTLKSASKWKLDYKGKYIRMTSDCNFGIIGYSDRIWFWEITKNKHKASYITIIKSLSLIQNNRYLLCATKYKVLKILLKTKKCKNLFTCPKGFSIHSISSDQTIAICQNKDSTTLFNILKNKKIADFNNINPSKIVISHNSNFLIILNQSNEFSIIDFVTKSSKTLQDTAKAYYFAIFHNDEFFVSIFHDNMLIWNIRELKIESKIIENFGSCNCLAITNDDRLLIYGSENYLKVWDLREKKYKGDLIGHKDVINVVCPSENCMFVASGSCDKDIMVWNLQEMEIVYVLKGHTRSVISIAIIRF